MKTLREMMDIIESTDQAVMKGDSKRFKIYYAFIEYDENDYEKTLPSEIELDEEIVVADNIQEALKKFRQSNPDAYIDSAEPLDQELEEVTTPESLKKIDDLFND